ncbi:MAG: hypothetical protein J6S60_09955 [Oscillospiraceae bacterium]|nr:hypothetical protein [Oscillospiraceae bacterium]
MIEKTMLDYLTGRLSVPVHLETPEKPPERYIVIQKTGSFRVNRVDQATFAVQSIAATLFMAAELNEAVKTAMDEMEDSVSGIFRVELNSDYNFTNTATKERRYQAVYNITFKE